MSESISTDKILEGLDQAAVKAASGDVSTVDTVDQDVYDQQESELTVENTEPVVTMTKTGGRAPRELDMTAINKALGRSAAERIKSTIHELPVKVQAKAQNVLAAVSSGVNLSGYTRYTFDFLKENEEVTTAEIVAMLEERGYKEGTARAQAQQQMRLLSHLNVAKRSGNKLVYQEDTPVSRAITAIA